MQEVLRQEKKFMLHLEEYIRHSHRLQQILTQDAHNGAHGYLIRSLYFDSIYDTDFFEKQDGTEIRKKIRLRCYDPNAAYATLEMKQKQGAAQRKRSLKMKREDAACLIQGDYSPLLTYPEDFARECYGLMQRKCYRPKTIVEYRRKAFIAKENKTRITFDFNIVSTESNFDLFAPQLAMYPVIDCSHVVLEVKYNGFLLSYIKQMLCSVEQSEISISKYCMARRVAYPVQI